MVREFKNLDELVEVDAAVLDNVLVIGEYRALCGPYSLEAELPCRLLKDDGEPCGEGHKHGWAVWSKSGALALVGGTCATKYFQAGPGIAQDARRITNELKRLAEMARLREKLANRDAMLIAVDAALRKVLVRRQQVAGVRDCIGRLAWRELEDMARLGSGAIRVSAVRSAVYNDDGDRIREGQAKLITVGQLVAIGIAKPSAMVVAADELRDIAKALRVTDEEALLNPRTKQARQLNAALSRHEEVLDRVDQFERDVEAFQTNPFELLAYAIRDKTERLKVVKAAFRMRGRPDSNEAAKAWLSAHSAALKSQHEVDRIHYGDRAGAGIRGSSLGRIG